MTRSVHKLVLAAALVVAGTAPGSAQELPVPLLPVPPMVPPRPPGSGPASTLLENWPNPPDEPPSLFRQAPAPTPYACAPLPGRYFERDPLLDPPQFPQPGCVVAVELQALVPHIFHDIVNTGTVGANAPGSVVVPVPGFDWTASPRIELGYRLPSGFGEFAINYQYIRTNGSGSTPFGPDGPANLRGTFEFNLSDFDYVSRQFTPWQYWGMKWRFGFRQLHMFYRSTLTQPFGAAAAGSGVLQEQGFNAYHGYGAHVGVELDRDLSRCLPGLSFVGKLDVANTFGFIRQSVSQTLVDGTFTTGVFRADQASPSLLGQAGLNYHPPGSRLDFYAGALYGYWWNLGKFNNVALNAPGKPTAKGDLSLTGFTFRVAWNY
jgi:hypothetical protein